MEGNYREREGGEGERETAAEAAKSELDGAASGERARGRGPSSCFPEWSERAGNPMRGKDTEGRRRKEEDILQSFLCHFGSAADEDDGCNAGAASSFSTSSIAAAAAP